MIVETRLLRAVKDAVGSVDSFADAIGCSLSTAYAYTSGRHPIPDSRVPAVTHALGLTATTVRRLSRQAQEAYSLVEDQQRQATG